MRIVATKSVLPRLGWAVSKSKKKKQTKIKVMKKSSQNVNVTPSSQICSTSSFPSLNQRWIRIELPTTSELNKTHVDSKKEVQISVKLQLANLNLYSSRSRFITEIYLNCLRYLCLRARARVYSENTVVTEFSVILELL